MKFLAPPLAVASLILITTTMNKRKIQACQVTIPYIYTEKVRFLVCEPTPLEDPEGLLLVPQLCSNPASMETLSQCF